MDALGSKCHSPSSLTCEVQLRGTTAALRDYDEMRVHSLSSACATLPAVRETLLGARSSSLLEVLPACHDDLRHDELLGRAWCVRLPAAPVSGSYVLDKCAPADRSWSVCTLVSLGSCSRALPPMSVPRFPLPGVFLTVCAAACSKSPRGRPCRIFAYSSIRACDTLLHPLYFVTLLHPLYMRSKCKI